MRYSKLLAALLLTVALTSGKNKHTSPSGRVEIAGKVTSVLWREPTDIKARNLFYGPGGERHQPRGTFTFVKEDMDGSNPKFVVKDQAGVKWKVKLGAEAKPETVASRLVWATGYFADEDYFLNDFKVEDMSRLHRGNKLVDADGTVHGVRLKRYNKDQDKMGSWEWRNDPFIGTREWNGLRVMMALLNNWDLKDVNNSVYEDENGVKVYLVSDLGATFGKPNPSWPHDRAKGNIDAYRHSKFIVNVSPQYVDFEEPGRPSFIYLVNLREYIRREHLRWIGKHIPRSDARWIGQLLAQLSPAQIRDAFRAGGYTSEEGNAFAEVLQTRIAQLGDL